MRILTIGTFDLFHAGHVALLKKCHEFAGFKDNLVVAALNSDVFVRNFKGEAPICSLEHRWAVLESCKYVDKVLLNVGGSDAKPVIEQAAPNWLVIGDDWLERDYLKQLSVTQKWLREKDITVVYVPYTKAISTSSLKQRMVDQWILP